MKNSPVYSTQIIDKLLSEPVYGLPAATKQALLCQQLNQHTQFHKQHCAPYRNILNAFNVPTEQNLKALDKFFTLNTALFKTADLRSISENQIYKTLYSSGTQGQPSKIFLDQYSARLQSVALINIMQHWLGKKRLPMLIIDHPGVIADANHFSARGAGIRGFSFLGRNHTYALNDDMSLNVEAIRLFMEKHQQEPVLLFGFTFMVWQYFFQQLDNISIHLPSALLLHGGGWKKLQQLSVSNEQFKQSAQELAGISRVHNFYGLVEQTGSIYMECQAGFLHSPVFSEILIKDPVNQKTLNKGEEGIITLLSALPFSYPGHALLTEDLGILLGEDDCSCGRKGRYFHITGRLPSAERRGCSDTYEPGSR